jgi:hypothetical protein
MALRENLIKSRAFCIIDKMAAGAVFPKVSGGQDIRAGG